MSQELEYLRKELNLRIAYSHERSHKVLGHLLLLWGGTLLLFAYNNLMEDIFLFFIVSTIFFISVVLICIFSGRELENQKQILKIAAYNTVFYEKIPCAKDEDKFYWELATYKIMIREREKKNSDEKSDYIGISNYTPSYEYFIFSLIATIMNSFLLLLLFLKFSKTLSTFTCPDILIIVSCFFYIGFSVFFLKKIHKNTNFNPQELFKERKKQMKAFIEDALEIGYYHTRDEIKARLGEDVWKEVYS